MIYRLGPDWPKTTVDLEAALAKEPFAPCTATQEQSVGWVPPRGLEHGALVESVDGQWIARLVVETKSVPGQVVRDRAEEIMDDLEARTGRRPGRREARDIREDALLALLPQAFPRRGSITLWLDPAKRRLALDVNTQGKADLLMSSLMRVAGHGFSVGLLETQMSPQQAMGNWLGDESGESLPAAFEIGRSCELKGSGEEPAVIKFTRHKLLTDEIRTHIAQEKYPTQLELDWRGRVGFVLTHTLQVKRIRFDEALFDDDPPASEDTFDADVALATGELGPMIDELLAALGGQLERG